jgi:RND family efflux transporter MFP subunit
MKIPQKVVPLRRCSSGSLLAAASAAEATEKRLRQALKRESFVAANAARLKACSTRRAHLGYLTVATLALATLVGCGESKPSGQAPAEKVHGVATMQVQKAAVPDVIEATGTVRAALSAQLASQVMGTITRVNVHEGDRVRRGEVLVSIDEAQQQAAYTSARAGLQASQESIAAADADYALAEATMKRYQTLYDKKSVSPQEYDEVKTKLTAAQARRDAARAGRTQAEAGVSQASTAMSFTKVRAPFDGIVISKLAEPGAMAAPGVPLLVVEDPSRFRLEAQVDESKMGAVKLGESVPVVIDALGDQVIEGKVTQIVPAADPSSRTFTVKIDLPESHSSKSGLSGAPILRSGLFGRARFPRGQRETIEIPKTAVLSRGQLQAVYVVGSDQLASLRYVTLGAASGEQVEVLSGLQNGDRIVVQPGDRELSGKQVEAQ